MTVIVGVVDPEAHDVVVAADRLGQDEAGINRYLDKLWVDTTFKDPVVLGLAGAHPVGALARSRITFPEQPANWKRDSDEWAQKIAESITQVGVDHKLVDEDDIVDSTGILACRDRMWLVGHYMAVLMPEEAAVGSGGQLAMGALYAMRSNPHPAASSGERYYPSAAVPAEQKARTAALAARAFHRDVGGQIQVARTARPA